MSYHTPNLDTGKAFKIHLQKGVVHEGGIVHQSVGAVH